MVLEFNQFRPSRFILKKNAVLRLDNPWEGKLPYFLLCMVSLLFISLVLSDTVGKFFENRLTVDFLMLLMAFFGLAGLLIGVVGLKKDDEYLLFDFTDKHLYVFSHRCGFSPPFPKKLSFILFKRIIFELDKFYDDDKDEVSHWCIKLETNTSLTLILYSSMNKERALKLYNQLQSNLSSTLFS